MSDDPGRRAVLFGGAAVAVGMGGLNPRPLNAPPAGQPGVGVQAGNTGILIGRLLLVFGPSGGAAQGVFVYVPGTTPALGNPPDESMSDATIDPFGNAVQPGITAYLAANHNVYVNLRNGVITLTASAAAADQWTVNAATISGTTYLALVNLGTAGTLFIAPGGTIIGPHPGALGTPESLQTPTTTGFGTVAGAQQVKYQIDAFGNVHITGAMAASGAYTAGTTIWTVPAGYRPAAIASVGVTIDTGGAFTAAIAQVDTSGNVSIPINVAAAAEVFFNGGHYRVAA